MSRADILNRLNEIFCDIFMDDSIDIDDQTTADDIEEWDSLMHITLVLATEKEFHIRLKAAEVGKLANVGSLIDIIEIGSS